MSLAARIASCLSSRGFLDEVRRRGYRLSYKDSSVFSLAVSILRECGVEADLSPESREWREAWRLLRRGGAAGARPAPRQSGDSVIENVTVLAAVYMALYDLYGHEAPRVAYEVLEDVMIDALGGRLDLTPLATPVSLESLRAAAPTLSRILAREPRLCSSRLPDYMCAVSRSLPRQHAGECRRMLGVLCREAVPGTGD